MKLNEKYEKFHNNSVVLIFIMSIIFMIITIYLTIHSYIEEQKSISVLATVNEVNYIDDKYIIKVSYIVEDYIYEQTITEKNEVTVTDLYQIKYNKDNPNILMKKDYTIAISICFSITIISLAISLEELITYIVKKRKKEELFNNGIRINAPIIDIYINNKAYKYKKKYPYRIRLEYLNPKDNKKYIFESENIYEDIKKVLKERNITQLPVYINKRNSNEYFIKLDSI